jgi:hypothetical protein
MEERGIDDGEWLAALNNVQGHQPSGTLGTGRVFLPTVGFLPLAGGKGSYRGIPLNTARIQISNQNRLKPLVQTVSR